MFTIGDFSRVARVSCRLLRYYDELGLLRPATVHSATGYRYYSASQLPKLNRILVLKELGFSLEEIARLTDQNVPAAELRGMLMVRRADSARALAAEAERLRQIETRIAQIDNDGQLSSEDVIIRDEPARQFLCVRDTVPSFASARTLLRSVSEAVRKHVEADSLGLLMAVAHSTEFETDRIDLQVGYALLRPPTRAVVVPHCGVMTIEELPGIARMATCVRIGLPEHAHLITARIARFIEANGYFLNGPSREVFLEPPQFEQMERSVVEMQFPLGAEPGKSGKFSRAQLAAGERSQHCRRIGVGLRLAGFTGLIPVSQPGAARVRFFQDPLRRAFLDWDLPTSRCSRSRAKTRAPAERQRQAAGGSDETHVDSHRCCGCCSQLQVVSVAVWSTGNESRS